MKTALAEAPNVSLRRLVKATKENRGHQTESIDNAMQSAEASLACLQATHKHLVRATAAFDSVLDELGSASKMTGSGGGDGILGICVRSITAKASTLDAEIRGLMLAIGKDEEVAYRG